MIDEPLGFHAKAPVSAWNQRLGVDYPGVFKALLKATLAAATANAPGAISAAIDGFFAFRVEEAKRPPEELAWLLIRRALTHAMAKLAVEALKRHDRNPDEPDGLVVRLDAALDGAEITIKHDFVERPAEHSIVDRTIGPFGEWLRAYGLNDAETQSVTRRLGAYFTLALHREWAAHADEYRILEAKLFEADTPFAKANTVERAWLKNAAYLQRLIREPVFDEPFGLHDVYVSLRAYYIEEAGEKTDFHQVRAERQRPEQHKIAVDLRKEFLRWLKADDPRDAVRLISGDPGCGKTSFAKELAAELADDWPQESAGAPRRVLFLPLHRFNFTGDLQLTLRNYLSAAGVLPTDYDPLDATSGAPRLLIFFDGLDEISEQGRPGREAIQKFAGQVDILARTLNHTQPRVFFILSGRQLSVDASQQYFQRPRQVLHALPYLIPDAKVYEVDPETGPGDLDTDLRQPWWQKYAAAKGKPYDGLPKPVDRPDLEAITGQPLLNYLLAQSLERGRLDFSTPISLNQIYGDLLAAVYERHWGDPEDVPTAPDNGRRLLRPGHPALTPLAWEEFVRLLEEVALLAWHGTGRAVAANAVEKACEDLSLKEKLEAFKQGAEAGAVSLLVSFFFRQAARIGGEPTFEFTHKSFGEYLAARRLVRALSEIQDDRADKAKRRRPWSEEAALMEWCRSTGPTALDRDLLAFLRRQVKLETQTTVEGWQRTYAELLSYQLYNGLPMHALGIASFREMTRQARNAEEALLASLNACALVTRERSQVDWPSETTLGELIKRLQGQREGAENVLAMYCLGWLDASSQILDLTDLYSSNLEFAGLIEARLQLAILHYATLVEADLTGADLWRADLERADLERADLEGANLEGANLEKANLEGANLEGANLFGANLEGANLEGANFEEASLVAVRHLDGARGLDKVKSWRGAKVERKWVERLGLDTERLGLVVVDDVDEESADAASLQA